jgi:hypothetical protein
MGFQVGFWDYATFGALIIIGAAIGGLVLLILGLPGKIAIARKHPEADAVNLMGWVGFLGVVPWIQALIWAFKPTDVVDIRRFPREEQAAIDEDIRATHRQACIGSIAGAGRGEKTYRRQKGKIGERLTWLLGCSSPPSQGSSSGWSFSSSSGLD